MNVADSDVPIDGLAVGAFAGGEYKISNRLSLGLDAGLYRISLKSNSLGVEESGMDFVLNSYLNFRVF